jgi:succinoglycan biosynthesis transport protein ExoP
MDIKTSELFDTFDIADLKFFALIAKKNIKYILFASALVSLVVFLISLNIEKKYLSEATIVIAPDENKIVNINEAYSTSIRDENRINNLIAILKSDEVISHIVNDEKNQLEFKSLYNKNEKNIFSRIFTKKTIIYKGYIN